MNILVAALPQDHSQLEDILSLLIISFGTGSRAIP